MEPSERQFKKKLETYDSDSMYIMWPEIKKQAVDKDMFYYNNTNEIKKRVIDSLKLTVEKNFIIVDASKDINGRTVKSYFFLKNKIVNGSFHERYVEADHPYVKFSHSITEETIENLKKNGNDVLLVYNYFNKQSFENIGGPIDLGSFVYYDITVVINREIAFYNIRFNFSKGYKVTRKM